MNEDFQLRLKQAFDGGRMSDIARRLKIPHATVRNYFTGRLPASDVLIKIARETNVSLNWLLIGVGEMYVSGERPIDLDHIFTQMIDELLDQRIGRRKETSDAGSTDEVGEFDVESALVESDDPQIVMSAWLRHEKREYPQDYGAVFFQGWENYTDEEKLAAVHDAKNVLDRSLKSK
jgi:AcrR family transcriptional regulator